MTRDGQPGVEPGEAIQRRARLAAAGCGFGDSRGRRDPGYRGPKPNLNPNTQVDRLARRRRGVPRLYLACKILHPARPVRRNAGARHGATTAEGCPRSVSTGLWPCPGGSPCRERPRPQFLTTPELANLFHIKERKVYELASSGEVPCSRPRAAPLPRQGIEAWIAGQAHGMTPARGTSAAGAAGQPRPAARGPCASGRSSRPCSSEPRRPRAIRPHRGGRGRLRLYAPESTNGRGPGGDSFGHASVVLVELAWRRRAGGRARREADLPGSPPCADAGPSAPGRRGDPVYCVICSTRPGSRPMT